MNKTINLIYASNLTFLTYPGYSTFVEHKRYYVIPPTMFNDIENQTPTMFNDDKNQE